MVNPVPKSTISLMNNVYRKVFPTVNEELARWEQYATGIPNEELRRQALASLATKRFHCQGGAIYALLGGDMWQQAVRFIVAYQTISDYLDNLCDRSTSMDPADFRLLHKALQDALIPENEVSNYYELRSDQNDGGYLSELVKTCQNILRNLDLSIIHDYLLRFQQLYSDLQVHKHVKIEERISRLTNWFKKNGENKYMLDWYEYSAAAGSTLGVFCMISYTLAHKMTPQLAEKITVSYFPYVQGLHILLDYYIDQVEDQIEGDLNFCAYYPDQIKLEERFYFFYQQAKTRIKILPDQLFHQMICQGLLGLYLGDDKIKQVAGGKAFRKTLLAQSGRKTKFFYWNTRIYNRIRKVKKPG